VVVAHNVQFETDDASSLEKRTVWLAVWHSDRFRSNVFLGDVIVPLHNYEFEGRPTWYPLQQQGREVGITKFTAYNVCLKCPKLADKRIDILTRNIILDYHHHRHVYLSRKGTKSIKTEL